jgi:hypothetical protein
MGASDCHCFELSIDIFGDIKMDYLSLSAKNIHAQL